MILRERIVKVTGENDTRAIYEHIKFWLVLFFSFLLIKSCLTSLSFLSIVDIDEFVFDGFDQVLKKEDSSLKSFALTLH